MPRHAINRPSRNISVALIVVLILGLGIYGWHTTVQADQVNGVSLTPAITQLNLETSPTATSYRVHLQNSTTASTTIRPIATDFASAGSGSQIVLRKTPDPLHGLQNNVSFVPDSLTLLPGKSGDFQITVQHATDLGPGGHYTVIRYQLIDSHAKAGDVSLTAELTSYLFLVTPGKQVYQLSLTMPAPRLALFAPPQTFEQLFTNSGNVQAAPHGTVVVTGPAKTETAFAQINTDSSIILPGSTRLFNTTVRPLQNWLWPGRYTIHVYYKATEANDFSSSQYQYIYVGWPAIIAVLGLLALVVWLFRRRRKPTPPQTLSTPRDQNHKRIIVKEL